MDGRAYRGDNAALSNVSQVNRIDNQNILFAFV